MYEDEMIARTFSLIPELSKNISFFGGRTVFEREVRGDVFSELYNVSKSYLKQRPCYVCGTEIDLSKNISRDDFVGPAALISVGKKPITMKLLRLYII